HFAIHLGVRLTVFHLDLVVRRNRALELRRMTARLPVYIVAGDGGIRGERLLVLRSHPDVHRRHRRGAPDLRAANGRQPCLLAQTLERLARRGGKAEVCARRERGRARQYQSKPDRSLNSQVSILNSGALKLDSKAQVSTST